MPKKKGLSDFGKKITLFGKTDGATIYDSPSLHTYIESTLLEIPYKNLNKKDKYEIESAVNLLYLESIKALA